MLQLFYLQYNDKIIFNVRFSVLFFYSLSSNNKSKKQKHRNFIATNHKPKKETKPNPLSLQYHNNTPITFLSELKFPSQSPLDHHRFRLPLHKHAPPKRPLKASSFTLRRLTGIVPSSERLGRFPLWDIALMLCWLVDHRHSAQPETF